MSGPFSVDWCADPQTLLAKCAFENFCIWSASTLLFRWQAGYPLIDHGMWEVVLSSGKRRPVWVDSAETRTAADLDTPEACDTFTQRIYSNIQHFIDGMDLPPGVPRSAKKLLALHQPPAELPAEVRSTLHFKKLGLMQLRDRKRELLADNTKVKSVSHT